MNALNDAAAKATAPHRPARIKVIIPASTRSVS
jgi:hypothetical protein